METPVRRFLLRLLLLTALVALAGFVLFRFFLSKYYHPLFLPLLLFVAFFSFISFFWIVKTAHKDTGRFARASMMVTMVRLFVYLSIAVICFLTIKSNALAFVICLASLYLIYTPFEVSELSRYLRNSTKKNTARPGGNSFTLSDQENSHKQN